MTPKILPKSIAPNVLSSDGNAGSPRAAFTDKPFRLGEGAMMGATFLRAKRHRVISSGELIQTSIAKSLGSPWDFPSLVCGEFTSAIRGEADARSESGCPHIYP